MGETDTTNNSRWAGHPRPWAASSGGRVFSGRDRPTRARIEHHAKLESQMSRKSIAGGAATACNRGIGLLRVRLKFEETLRRLLVLLPASFASCVEETTRERLFHHAGCTRSRRPQLFPPRGATARPGTIWHRCGLIDGGPDALARVFNCSRRRFWLALGRCVEPRRHPHRPFWGGWGVMLTWRFTTHDAVRKGARRVRL